MDAILEVIREAVPLLAVEKAVSPREAERRAGHFLFVQALIADALDTLGDEKIASTSLRDAIYPKLLSSDSAKQVTEKKANVEGHPDYLQAREMQERTDNKVNYLKTYFKIFENAHVFYRQLAKGDFNG